MPAALQRAVAGETIVRQSAQAIERAPT